MLQLVFFSCDFNINQHPNLAVWAGRIVSTLLEFLHTTLIGMSLSPKAHLLMFFSWVHKLASPKKEISLEFRHSNNYNFKILLNNLNAIEQLALCKTGASPGTF